MKSLPDKIKKRVQAKGRGWVFTPKDFLDLGSRVAVDTALSRMVTDNQIQRLAHGLYYFPKTNPIIGLLSADADAIADAIARKTGDAVYPTGADAANLLGLSTQVPAKIEYLTTGNPKVLNVSGRTITLKKAPLAAMQNISRAVRLAIHALLYLGDNGINDKVVTKLKGVLNKKDKQQLLRVTNYLPSWLAPTIKLIAM